LQILGRGRRGKRKRPVESRGEIKPDENGEKGGKGTDGGGHSQKRGLAELLEGTPANRLLTGACTREKILVWERCGVFGARYKQGGRFHSWKPSGQEGKPVRL